MWSSRHMRRGDVLVPAEAVNEIHGGALPVRWGPFSVVDADLCSWRRYARLRGCGFAPSVRTPLWHTGCSETTSQERIKWGAGTGGRCRLVRRSRCGVVVMRLGAPSQAPRPCR